MPCPTCSHTLATLVQAEGLNYRHCERCGTVIVEPAGFGWTSIYRPKLVDRCREFRAQAASGLSARAADMWHTLGIHEATTPTNER
jgi:ribosomal protein S27E